MPTTLQLTKEEALNLKLALLMTHSYRTNEAETYHKLSWETSDDGQPRYSKAAGNARVWDEINSDMEKIIKMLSP